MTVRNVKIIAWASSLIPAALAVTAWGQYYRWHLDRLTVYQWFPLLGLLAFSLMWSHYIASAVRQYSNVESEALKTYFTSTSLVVLALILLHPGLIEWKLWATGHGLPPSSLKAYVGSALFGSVVLGIIAWLCFLTYELHRFFSGRSWWKYVQYASDLAMVLVFIHGLRLGRQLQHGWYRYIWFFYGVTFLGSLAYGYWHKSQKLKNS